MSNTNAAQTYYVSGTEALQPQQRRRLVLIDGGREANSPQSPRTYHEQATSSPSRVITTAQGILAFCLALAVVIAVFSATLIKDSLLVSARDEALSGVAFEEVVVLPGESLWQIAESHPVEGVPTSDVVTFILETNSLTSSSLSVGQHLMVPVG